VSTHAAEEIGPRRGEPAGGGGSVHTVQAAEAVRAALGPDHPTTAIARAHLAFAIERDRPAEALALYSDGLRILSLHPEQLTAAIPDYLSGVGRAALAARKPAVALAWFDRHPVHAGKVTELRAALERVRARGR
jgi:hypothetical protein